MNADLRKKIEAHPDAVVELHATADEWASIFWPGECDRPLGYRWYDDVLCDFTDQLNNAMRRVAAGEIVEASGCEPK